MLPYELIEIICEYLDKTIDRFILHICCGYHNYYNCHKLKDMCGLCESLVDKWDQEYRCSWCRLISCHKDCLSERNRGFCIVCGKIVKFVKMPR